jgi:REP element-mobilizing transposase RayT
VQPIYTLANTTPAYQLNWSVSLFGRAALPPSAGWLEQLRRDTERDGVRILEFRGLQANVGQFFVSTRPTSSPSDIVRSVKGRLQYLLRVDCPRAFRRNYFIGSVGEANSEALDRYVAGQPAKHPMADPGVQARMEALQFHDPAIDLAEANTGNYGQFAYGLQVVVENAGGWSEVRESVLAESRSMIVRASAKKAWRLSRIGLVSNHLHILLGAGVTESPAEVALSLMNNLAYGQGMKPVFRFSYYVGTFGPYDRDAVRRGVSDSR